MCDGGPSSAEARCLAVSNLGPHIEEFLAVANQDFSSKEERLLATCKAGDQLLKSVVHSRAISSIVSDKLIDSYFRAIDSNLDPLDFQGVDAHIKQFREDTEEYVREIHRLAFKSGDESGQLLLSIEMAEIEYAEMMLRGLSQCITAPREELDTLATWKLKSSSKAEEIARLDKRKAELSAKSTNHPTLLWMQLNLWPLVLILALSMKFAKGSAALRTAWQKKRKGN